MEKDAIMSEFDLRSAETKKNAKTDARVIGYCRISTPSQNIQRQRRNIKEKFPTALLVEEVYTGTKLDRPKWDAVMRLVRQGKVDTIVFDSVSRMSRNEEEGCKLYLELYKRGINLVFLKEPHVNTDVYKNALKQKIDVDLCLDDKATTQLMQGIFKSLNGFFESLATRQIELAFEQSQKEVDDLRLRTKEGLLSARLRGVQLGRTKGTRIDTKKSIKCKRIIRKRFTLFGGDLNATECCRLCGDIARSTFYRYLNQMLSDDAKEREEKEAEEKQA